MSTAVNQGSAGTGGQEMPRPRGRGLLSWMRFLLAYVTTNLQVQMEYRASFISQVIGMFINDGLWLAFWALYFTRFPVVNGWERSDVMLMWAVLTFGFGLSMGPFGNTINLSQLIAQGQLDYYLALPRPVLSHTLVSNLWVSAVGDLLFGPLVFVLFTHPTWPRAGIFLVTSVLGGAILLSYNIIVHSLSFFIGNAEMLSYQLGGALVSFSTYPPGIFRGAAKVFLYTVIPALFLGAVPVTIIRQFRWDLMGLLILVAVSSLLLARWVFYKGLARYESGNLMVMRS